MSSNKNVGFIGLGSMGFGMATHLIQHGFQVAGYDIQENTRTKFEDAGGSTANSPGAVVELSHCRVLVVMVATAEQAFDVLFHGDSGAGANLPRDAVVLLCITAAPKDAIRIRHFMSRDLGRSDIVVLDCPVSGGANRAADGSLSILFAGAADVPNSAIQVLDALSAHRFHVPGPPGSAFILKMIHQILVGVHIVAAVETAALAMLAGLNLESLERDVMASSAASWLYGERMPHLRDMERPPYSSLAIILKDLDLVIAAATSARQSLPLSTVAQHTFLATKTLGLGTHDDCLSIQTYLGHRGPKPTSDSNSTISAETIRDLLIGIHLAAALEAFSLVDALELDRNIFYNFVLTAAGASKVFVESGSLSLATLSSAKVEEIETIISKMAGAMDTIEELQCATPLCIQALKSLLAAFPQHAQASHGRI